MSMIAMCFHDTEENGRTEYSRQTLESLMETVNFSKHRLIMIDNNSCQATKDILKQYVSLGKLITLSENVGTARGINFAIKKREPGEMVCKMDNDTVVHESGWLEKMEYVFEKDKSIGIIGLRRDDVWQKPDHENPAYRVKVEKCGTETLWVCDDIIGTCTGLRPELLDKVGYYVQNSPYYSFDDSLMNVRSIAAGFRNAFLPHIKITHLDDGKNPYCDWKKKEANEYLVEACELMELIKNGTVNYYYGYN